MAIFKDVYMVFRLKDKGKTIATQQILKMVKNQYGYLGLGDVFYIDIKEHYAEKGIFIVWCPRTCQKMIKDVLERSIDFDCEHICDGGTIKKTREKALKAFQ